jgi:hypothetical protein
MIKDLMNLANSLDSKGLTKEADVLDLLIKKIAQQDDINLEDLDVDYEPYGHYELKVYSEPPVNIEDVKTAFLNHFLNSRTLITLDVESIEWESEPSEYPHYKVKSLGSYKSWRTGSIEDYRIDTDFWIQDYGEPVKGTDGNIYHFYGED